jgi:hypothetical protein
MHTPPAYTKQRMADKNGLYIYIKDKEATCRELPADEVSQI